MFKNFKLSIVSKPLSFEIEFFDKSRVLKTGKLSRPYISEI